jgi:2,3-bisphosphoglycerate-independent phosphoglycerate mutase
MASIETIDKHFFGDLLPKLDMKETIVVVTADHSTPCILKAHSADPAPLLVAGGSIKTDGTMSFSERAAAKGSFGEIIGKDLMGMLIGLAKK